MSKYDYDLIVVGGGAAGLTAATGAGQLGAKTLLVEKEQNLGGDCLHYGCVPSKSLIKSAYCYNVMKQAARYGLPSVTVPPVDFKQVRERIRGIIQIIQSHDTAEWIKEKYNVDTVFGAAQFIDPHTMTCGEHTVTAKSVIIATGSSPVIPPIKGIKNIDYLTNRSIFYIDQLPESLVVLGGGPIGAEMAQAFARLGTRVTLLQSPGQLLPKEDRDVADYIHKRLVEDGVDVWLNSRAVAVAKHDGRVRVTVDQRGEETELSSSHLLVATGRRANVEDLRLGRAGVDYTPKGIRVDARLRTTAKHIFAAGDVNGGFQFTHIAGYEGGLAMVNAVMRVPAKADYTKVPWCTYLDPEVASVGYNERWARKEGVRFSVHKEEFKDNDRALTEGEPGGFIKILINRRGVPVGAQIVGYHAGDLIHEWVAAINGRVSLSTLAQSIHAYPTMAEISKTASGNYLAPRIFNNSVRETLKLVLGLQGGPPGSSLVQR